MTVGLSGLGTRRRRSGLPLLPIISTLMILAAAGIFVFQLVIFSQQQERLPDGVYVAGVDVSGMLPGAAVAQWENALYQPVTLWYGENPISLRPEGVGFRINSASMLAEAESAGGAAGENWGRFFNHLTGQESETIVNVRLSAEYQENLLDQFLMEISRRYDRAPGKAAFDPQTLTLRPDSGGFALNIRAAVPLIDAALRSPTNRSVKLPIGDTGAGSRDISVLRDLIIAYLDSKSFIYDGQTTVASVYIMDLQTGEEINLNSDVAFSAASTIKVPIMIDYYRHLSLAPNDDEAFLMANSLLCSNNSSSNLIMRIIGGGTSSDIFKGISEVTQNAQYLGARNTFLTAPLYEGYEGQQLGSIPAPATTPNRNFNTGADPYNQTTAEDMGTLFGLIYDCAYYGSGLMAAYPNGEFTQNECRQMLELMSANDLMRMLQGGIPEGTRISHKNGWLDNIHGDAGIVFPPNGRNYIIAVFLWEDVEFFSYTTAWPLIEDISRAAWNYFSPEAPMLTARDNLPITANECNPQGGNGFLPPYGQVNLNDINAWRSDQ